MGKHAYLIAANSNLSVVRTCLRMIDDKRNDIYLLFDKKSRFSEEIIQSIQEEVNQSKACITSCVVVNWEVFTDRSCAVSAKKRNKSWRAV